MTVIALLIAVAESSIKVLVHSRNGRRARFVISAADTAAWANLRRNIVARDPGAGILLDSDGAELREGSVLGAGL